METLEIAASITSDEYIVAPKDKRGSKANVPKSDSLLDYLKTKYVVVDGILQLALPWTDLIAMNNDDDLYDQVLAHIKLLASD